MAGNSCRHRPSFCHNGQGSASRSGTSLDRTPASAHMQDFDFNQHPKQRRCCNLARMVATIAMSKPILQRSASVGLTGSGLGISSQFLVCWIEASIGGGTNLTQVTPSSRPPVRAARPSLFAQYAINSSFGGIAIVVDMTVAVE